MLGLGKFAAAGGNERYRLPPLLFGLLSLCVTFSVSGVCLLVLFRQGKAALQDEVRGGLMRTATAVAAMVDGDQHRLFVSPAQEDTPEYRQAIAPLRKIQAARRDIRFIYTMILHEGQPHIILDATPPGDADGDGVEDHSPIMELYDVPAPALMDALLYGIAQADEEPVTDHWGTYISGYAPLHDSQGRLVGVAGIDMNVDRYQARLARMRNALHHGLLLAVWLSLVAGASAWWLQRRILKGLWNMHQARRQLQAHERRFVTAVESLAQGFGLLSVVRNDQNEIVDFAMDYLNGAGCALTQLNKIGVEKRTVNALLAAHPETPAIFDELRAVAETGIPLRKVCDFCADGESRSRRILDVRAVRLDDGLVVVSHDITESRVLEEERVRTQKLESLGVLAGGIAHDFNNILTAILGNTSLARQAVTDDPESLHELLAETETATMRATQLTRQLLNFARGGTPLKKSQPVADVVRHAAQFAISGAQSRVQCELAEDLWLADVDAAQIGQVVQNMVINADQAMPGGGTVLVAAGNQRFETATSSPPYKAGAWLKISVSDTGIGIPPENRGRIFDPYFSTKPGNSGLGLATSLSIVSKHGGYITVESQVNCGSTFSLWLPALPEDKPLPPPETDTTMSAKAPLAARRILVVDDEEAILSFSRRVLEAQGHAVTVVNNGPEAIALYEQARSEDASFDLVLLDLTVPGSLSGVETLKRLRRLDPHVRAVVASGYADDPVLANYREFQFCARMSKPYTQDDLLSAVEVALRQE